MLDRMVTDLCLMRPFMARTALTLTMRFGDVPTARTDGRVVEFSEAFLAKLNEAERLGVLAHEVGHVLLCHFLRRGARDRLKWNVAADLELNQVLEAAGFTLPFEALLPATLGLPPAKCAEEYYAMLPECVAAGNECMGEGADEGAGDGAGEGDGAAWRADIAAASWGSDVPDAVRRIFERVIEPPPPLASRIAQWLRATLPGDDETWAPPSRRWSLLPGIEDRPSGHVAVCIDTSGSVDAGMMARMVSDIRALSDVGRVDVICADTRVRTVYLDVQDATELEMTGGGGTDFRAALDCAATLGADCAIYMTDGQGDRAIPLPLPTYWHILEQRP